VLTNVSPLSWEAAGSPAASQLSVSQQTNRRRVTRPPGVTGINVALRHPPLLSFRTTLGSLPTNQRRPFGSSWPSIGSSARTV